MMTVPEFSIENISSKEYYSLDKGFTNGMDLTWHTLCDLISDKIYS